MITTLADDADILAVGKDEKEANPTRSFRYNNI